MNPIDPEAPFVWPEPLVLEEYCTYTQQPPFGRLAQEAHTLFGLVSGLTGRGVDVLDAWSDSNPDLKARLIVMVYPACSTRRADLERLLHLVERNSARLSVHIRPLESVSDRGTNALCFVKSKTKTVHLVTGPSEDLGFETLPDGHVNFVFRAPPVLVEAFRRFFDLQWANSRDLAAAGAAEIPHLVLGEGTEEGARMWRNYVKGCTDEETEQPIAHVDPATGDVTILSEDGHPVPGLIEDLGVPKLDALAGRMARLYEKGVLVSIDKLSRIPPLDAPLDPNVFGDPAELQRGNVTRKVSVRVSIIDQHMLKEIEKRRQGLRPLLAKFTFGLADNTRWMPATAHGLFESELTRAGEEGRKLIEDLLKGDVDAFIVGKLPVLVASINAMYTELRIPGQATRDVIDRVVESLKDRLSKAESSNFMPKLTYSRVSFEGEDSHFVSPWGQAYSLLADIAAFPRKALTDRFFFSGLKVSEDDLIKAMNVADDTLCKDLRTRGIIHRSKAELELLSRIEKTPMDSRDRCELVLRILDGDSIDGVDDALRQKEAS
ncbi:MAG TPA: hypothetical protein PK250_15960 [Syntrophobacter fumaroxidans]|nr:hypothetical protein [Syntrophobacter fumaroxidans]